MRDCGYICIIHGLFSHIILNRLEDIIPWIAVTLRGLSASIYISSVAISGSRYTKAFVTYPQPTRTLEALTHVRDSQTNIARYFVAVPSSCSLSPAGATTYLGSNEASPRCELSTPLVPYGVLRGFPLCAGTRTLRDPCGLPQ